MGDLTGKRIDLTYDGLIKTNDEQPVNGTLKGLQDGVGNNLPVQISTTGINFTGTVTGDNNTTYVINTIQDGSNVVLELQPDTGGSVDVNLIPGSGITLTNTSNRNIEIAATGGGGATYTINAVQNGLDVDLQLLADAVVVDTITLQAGGNVQLTQQGQAVVFASTDTNTTYDLLAAQNGANVEIQLDPSVGTTDVVTLAAGTNVTLTQAGSEITIDAASSGAGLVSGAGTDSMQSAAGLTTVAADATGNSSIAIGNSALSTAFNQITIGNAATAQPGSEGGISIGGCASLRGVGPSIVIGSGADVGPLSIGPSNGSIVIGNDALSNAVGSISLGPTSQSTGENSIAIGLAAVSSDIKAISIGNSANAAAERSIAIGASALATGANGESVAVGASARAEFDCSISLGYQACSQAIFAVSLGAAVVATNSRYTTTRKLELCETVPMNYPDDTQAATGGVPVGGVYHDNGILRIRLV